MAVVCARRGCRICRLPPREAWLDSAGGPPPLVADALDRLRTDLRYHLAVSTRCNSTRRAAQRGAAVAFTIRYASSRITVRCTVRCRSPGCCRGVAADGGWYDVLRSRPRIREALVLGLLDEGVLTHPTRLLFRFPPRIVPCPACCPAEAAFADGIAAPCCGISSAPSPDHEPPRPAAAGAGLLSRCVSVPLHAAGASATSGDIRFLDRLEAAPPGRFCSSSRSRRWHPGSVARPRRSASMAIVRIFISVPRGPVRLSGR